MSDELEILGPAGMTLVNDKATELAGAARVPPPGLAGRQPIRELLSAAVPGLSAEFLDSAAKFEASTSGRAVLTELRTLVANGIGAGRVPRMELCEAADEQYSWKIIDGVVHVYVPKGGMCKDDSSHEP
jgi:hypothetical protein